jgi:hypothetical protein
MRRPRPAGSALGPSPVLALSAVLFAGAALLAGCGSSSGNGVASKSPAEIVAAARAAADAASSVRIAGTIANERTPISLDMELLAGWGGRGKVAQSGLSFQLIQVGGSIYIDGSAPFYRRIGGPAAAQLLQGRWLKAPASTGEFAPIASLTSLTGLMSSALASHGALTDTGVTTVDGQRAVGIEDVSEGGILYVATTGKPYPIEVLKHSGSAGRIVFDRWNKPVPLIAPANAIDIAKLQSAH